MKILFLDIDGVIQTERSALAATATLNGLRVVFDPVAIGILNRICRETRAKIVIQSTWKNYYNVETIQIMLIQNGFTGEFFAQTSDEGAATPVSPLGKVKEMEEWFTLYAPIPSEFEGWCMIDDCDYDWTDEQRTYWIQTHEDVGISVDTYRKAISILGRN